MAVLLYCCTTETAVTLRWRQFVLNLDKASTSYAMPIKSKNIRMVSSSGSGMTSGLKSHLE